MALTLISTFKNGFANRSILILGFWSRNSGTNSQFFIKNNALVMMVTMICWWFNDGDRLNCHQLYITKITLSSTWLKPLTQNGCDYFDYVGDCLNVSNRSPTSQSYHQHIFSPTSVEANNKCAKNLSTAWFIFMKHEKFKEISVTLSFPFRHQHIINIILSLWRHWAIISK